MNLEEGGSGATMPQPKHKKTRRNWWESEKTHPADAHMQRIVEDLPPEDRRQLVRELTAFIADGAKLLVGGLITWVIAHQKQAILSTAMVATVSVGGSAIQLLPEPSEAPDIVTMPDAPDGDAGMYLPFDSAPMATTSPSLTPSPATTPRAPGSPARGDPTTTPSRPVVPTLSPSTTPPVAEPTKDPTDLPAFQVPERPTATPAPSPTPTATLWTPPPPPGSSPTPTPTPTNPPSGSECVDLSEEYSVSQVCEPPAEVDQEDRWRECLNLPPGQLVRCVINPDEWFADTESQDRTG